MKHAEHIGIAVKDLTVSIPLFEKLLNARCYHKETIEDEKLITAFFKTGETKIELLQSIDEDSVIAKFINKKGEGLHHIAFEVKNIIDEVQRLKKEGFIFLNEEPKPGADNKMICFIHPKSANGILIELCETIK